MVFTLDFFPQILNENITEYIILMLVDINVPVKWYNETITKIQDCKYEDKYPHASQINKL